MKKIVVGLSGGVDSAVAAGLLKKEYEVIGVTLQMQGDCFALKDIEDARNVAAMLGIEHRVINCQERFAAIKEAFAQSYINGRTPNPCVMCNPTVKWAALCEYADEIGAEYVATGHYANVEKVANAAGAEGMSDGGSETPCFRYALKAADSGKDQTYALYGLKQEQLARTIMPLGRFKSKDEVRAIAKEMGLSISDKPDSMEVCFIPDNDYAKFIRESTGVVMPAGNFVDESGKVLGEHKGIIHYTVGQRKGLGIAFGEPMFVKRIDAGKNEVVLSKNEALFTDTLTAVDVNLMGVGELKPGMRARGKIRYAHKGETCQVVSFEEYNGGRNKLVIRFDAAVRAVTPGQSVVLYDECNRVMCGGIIE